MSQITPIKVSRVPNLFRTPRLGVSLKMLDGNIDDPSNVQYAFDTPSEDQLKTSLDSDTDVNDHRSLLKDVELVPEELMTKAKQRKLKHLRKQSLQHLPEFENDNAAAHPQETLAETSQGEGKSRKTRQINLGGSTTSRFLNYLAIASGSHTVDVPYGSLEDVSKLITGHQKSTVSKHIL